MNFFFPQYFGAPSGGGGSDYALLLGPSSATEGYPSSAFTVYQTQDYTGTVTFSDSSSGGTFTPSSLTWSGTEQAQTFTYTPAETGTVPISASGSGLTFVGSPVDLVVGAQVQFFEQALASKLASITVLTAILGTQADETQPAIFKTGVPQTWQYSSGGAALSWFIPTKPKGQTLVGSDGTATANVQIDVWSFDAADPKRAMAAIFNAINGVPGTWGDGSCTVVSVVHKGDSDMDEQPRAGSDQWLYRTMSEYRIMYRLSAGGG